MQPKCGHEGNKGSCFGPTDPDFLAGIHVEKRKNVLADLEHVIVGFYGADTRFTFPIPANLETPHIELPPADQRQKHPTTVGPVEAVPIYGPRIWLVYDPRLAQVAASSNTKPATAAIAWTTISPLGNGSCFQ